MKKYAVVVNEIVQDIVFADTMQDAEDATGHTCVESTDENPAVVGLGYDGETFEQPVIVYPTLED